MVAIGAEGPKDESPSAIDAIRSRETGEEGQYVDADRLESRSVREYLTNFARPS